MSETRMVKLDAFGISELRELIDLATDELRKKEKAREYELVEEWRRKAEAEGFSFEKMMSAHERSKKRSSQPQYRNGDDASQVWSGRGRMPDWLKQKIQAGHKIGEFRI